MPLYEYECTECKEVTELFYSIKEDRPEEVRCEACGKVAKKFMSKSSFRMT